MTRTAVIVFLALSFHLLSAGGCGTSGSAAKGGDAFKSAVDELTQGVYQRVPPTRKTSVAIVGFTPVDRTETQGSAFSRYLVEELTTRFVNDGRVKVAERAQLEKVLSELRLQSSGAVSDASAKQLGQLLGVDSVLLGTYADFGREVRVNERLIATESGEVLAAASTTMRKNKMVMQLLGQAKRNRK